MSEKIYLKIDQQRYVKKPKVTIGDVMTVYCSDKDMIEKIGHITLAEFTLGKYDRKVFDALDVVGVIQKEYPDADIECLGECDFVVEYKKPEKEGTVHWIKVAVICFITMVGSGYGIIAYNNDVSTTDIFDRVYELLGASAYKATNAMEIAYAVGLFIGIVIFYDHFAGQSCQKHQHRLRLKWINMTKIYQNLLLIGKVENDSGYYSYRGYVGSVYCSRTFCTYNQCWCY